MANIKEEEMHINITISNFINVLFFQEKEKKQLKTDSSLVKQTHFQKISLDVVKYL